MKVLIVQTRYPPALGGQEKHVHQLARGLAANGHDISVYTTSSISSEDVYSLSLRPPFILKPRVETNLVKQERLANIEVSRFRLEWRYWSLNWMPDMFKELKRSTAGFDLVHAHGYHHTAALVSCYYAKKFGVPFILTAHDLAIARSLPIDAQSAYRLYEKSFGQFILKNSAALIALTDDQIGQYVARGGDPHKISVIPNGIELANYTKCEPLSVQLTRHGIAETDKIILFVGRIIERKGIQDIVAIMPQITDAIPDVKLVVAGQDYGYKSTLEALVSQKNLEANVFIIESLSDQEVAQLYRVSSVLALPSQMEGFGLVLVEAMASGTLCIAYSLPSVRKVIQHGVNGVLVNNKAELLENLLFYLSHPEQKEEIEKNAKRSASQYDIRHVVAATEQIYERCLR